MRTAGHSIFYMWLFLLELQNVTKVATYQLNQLQQRCLKATALEVKQRLAEWGAP